MSRVGDCRVLARGLGRPMAGLALWVALAASGATLATGAHAQALLANHLHDLQLELRVEAPSFSLAHLHRPGLVSTYLGVRGN